MDRLDALLSLKLLSLNLRDATGQEQASAGEPVPDYAIDALAQDLKCARLEIVAAVQRLEEARLAFVRDSSIKIHGYALAGMIRFAFRHLFPVAKGRDCVGMPTAHAAAPMNRHLFGATSRIPVWPSPHGQAQGYAIEPLHPMAPYAANEDPTLYALLSLVDSIRVGGAREVGVAHHLLVDLLSLPKGWPAPAS